MEVIPPLVPVSDRSAVGAVRRGALALARVGGFSEEAGGRVAIVASELASNMIKHGEGGHCFLSLAEEAGETLVQIVAVDRGGGIDDPGHALQDGYSTAGTPGTGLGAVQRLSRSFDLFSQPDGVVVVARVGPAEPHRPRIARAAVEVGAVESAFPGEPVSGDAWALERGAVTTLLVADGLGHGPFASEASRAATVAFKRHAGRPPVERVELIHEAMRGTRGGAIAIAEIDPERNSVRYAGLGNIAAHIVAGSSTQNLVSMNGTAGHRVRTVREFSYDFPPQALLVVHSDGVSARWTLDRYPGITLRDPAVIAALLHRDHGRERDDATVVVARHAATPSHAGPLEES